jgi:hypothetical protein
VPINATAGSGTTSLLPSGVARLERAAGIVADDKMRPRRALAAIATQVHVASPPVMMGRRIALERAREGFGLLWCLTEPPCRKPFSGKRALHSQQPAC